MTCCSQLLLNLFIRAAAAAAGVFDARVSLLNCCCCCCRPVWYYDMIWYDTRVCSLKEKKKDNFLSLLPCVCVTADDDLMMKISFLSCFLSFILIIIRRPPALHCTALDRHKAAMMIDSSKRQDLSFFLTGPTAAISVQADGNRHRHRLELRVESDLNRHDEGENKNFFPSFFFLHARVWLTVLLNQQQQQQQQRRNMEGKSLCMLYGKKYKMAEYKKNKKPVVVHLLLFPTDRPTNNNNKTIKSFFVFFFSFLLLSRW